MKQAQLEIKVSEYVNLDDSLCDDENFMKTAVDEALKCIKDEFDGDNPEEFNIYVKLVFPNGKTLEKTESYWKGIDDVKKTL